MKYRPEIDGLRAIAVLSVFLFHLDIHFFSGGFVGVDVFFVISGYLITSIIYKDLQQDKFTYSRFYERRIRRIIPALYIVLFFTSLFTFKLFMTEDFTYYSKSLLSSLLFYSNLLFQKQSGYFDLNADEKPLLHTWSLAIEEQFYIIFPILLLMAFRYFRKYLVLCITIFMVVSFSAGIWALKNNSISAFYMMPYRGWELLLGSLIALAALPQIKNRFINEILSFIGISLIVWGILFLTRNSTFPGFNALIPCLGTAMIIYCALNDQTKTIVRSTLASPLFVGVGKISYSLYLWHWPLIVFFKYYFLESAESVHRLWIMPIAMILAFMSWKYIEQPFRKKEGIFRKTKPVFVGLVLITLLLALYGYMTGYVEGIIPWRISPVVSQYAQGALDINPERIQCHKQGLVRAKTDDLCTLGTKKSKAEFIVWGDSHADALMPALQKLANETKTYGIYASKSSCRPLLNTGKDSKNLNECTEFNDLIISYIERNSIPIVLLVGRWSMGLGAKSDIENQLEENLVPVNKKRLMNFINGFENTIQRLEDNKISIWLIGKTPASVHRIPSALGLYTLRGKSLDELQITLQDYRIQTKNFDDMLEKIREKHKINVIRLSDLLCSQTTQRCMVEKDGRALYRDNHHLSTFGAYYVSPLLRPFFDAVLIHGKQSAP